MFIEIHKDKLTQTEAIWAARGAAEEQGWDSRELLAAEKYLADKISWHDVPIRIHPTVSRLLRMMLQGNDDSQDVYPTSIYDSPSA